MSQNINFAALSDVLDEPHYDSTSSAFDSLASDLDSFYNDLNSSSSESNNTKKTVPKSRKRKTTREKAESQFDFKAAPIKLGSYFSEFEVNPPIHFNLSQETDLNEIETKPALPDTTEIQIQSVVEISVARRFADNELIDEYNLDSIFVEPIEESIDQSIKDINNPINLSGNNKEEFEHLDAELFVQRRIFSAARLITQIKPHIKQALNLKKDITNVDHNKLFNRSSSRSLGLTSAFRNMILEDEHLRYCFDFFEDKVDVDKFNEMCKKKPKTFSSYMTCAYVVFNDPSLLKDDRAHVHDIHHEFASRFRINISITQLFHSIGIGFFQDYFDFSSQGCKIAPLLGGLYLKHAVKGKFIIPEMINKKRRRVKRN